MRHISIYAQHFLCMNGITLKENFHIVCYLNKKKKKDKRIERKLKKKTEIKAFISIKKILGY